VESDLGEYGKHEVVCVSKVSPFFGAVQKKMISASLLYGEGKKVGFLLGFEENNSFVVLNLDDEIFIFDKLPENIESEEGFIFVEIDKVIRPKNQRAQK